MARSSEFSLSFLAPARIHASMREVGQFVSELQRRGRVGGASPDDARSMFQPSTTSDAGMGSECGGPECGGSAFWNALRQIQSADLPPRRPHVQLRWYEGGGDRFATALGTLMGGSGAEREAEAYPLGERDTIARAFEAAMATFAEWLPETFASFVAMTGFVILARRAGYSGGTVSNRIGLIWLAPEADWTIEHWVENLVHEFVHNALFLEDMVHGVLVAGADRLEQPDALAISAIRQVRRGYDKAYHSGFVSVTLVEFYERLGMSQRGRPFVSPLLVCVEDLVRQRAFATPHGCALLDELAATTLAAWERDGRLAVA